MRCGSERSGSRAPAAAVSRAAACAPATRRNGSADAAASPDCHAFPRSAPSVQATVDISASALWRLSTRACCTGTGTGTGTGATMTPAGVRDVMGPQRGAPKTCVQ